MLLRAHLVGGILLVAAFIGRMSHAQSAPTSPDRDTGQPLLGCYRLTLGPWSKASALGPARPTAVVRLDTLPRQPGQPDHLLAERVEPTEFVPPGDPREQWRRPARWRRVGADSVEIYMWSTTTENETFYGRRDGTALRGVVRRTNDQIPIDPVTREVQHDWWPWAAASVVPVPCP